MVLFWKKILLPLLVRNIPVFPNWAIDPPYLTPLSCELLTLSLTHMVAPSLVVMTRLVTVVHVNMEPQTYYTAKQSLPRHTRMTKQPETKDSIDSCRNNVFY